MLHNQKANALCKHTKFNKMAGTYHKEAFEKLSEKRQKEILEIAIEEFSSKGYKNANINIIAKNVGISIGLMYKIFCNERRSVS